VLLTIDQVQHIAQAVQTLERLFGQPQDVEWGFAKGRLHLFQSRPITRLAGSYYTDVIPGDNHLWTSGFLNERFAQPVSPLGWTLIRDLLEPLAFRQPLRYMGFRWPDQLPITKLYRGHPFVNLRVFQILYKPFPNWLLPEDARRYFPSGDTELRRQAAYPCCLFDPRFVAAMLWHFSRDPANWSPLHNARHWARFLRTHDQAMAGLGRQMDALNAGSALEAAWSVFTEAQDLNARLLAIHRWSLTDADLFYSLLRRMLACWLDEASGNELSARLVAGLPNKSVELNRALCNLITDADWQAFLAAYGHRSFSLDIHAPTFAEQPDQIKPVAGDLNGRLNIEARVAQRESARAEARRALWSQRWGWLKVRLFDWVLGHTQGHMVLREEQRFYWQKTLALQRRLILWIGHRLVARGWLKRPEDVFFATLAELLRAVAGEPFPPRELAHRRSEFSRLQQAFASAPHASYPGFLRGNQPVVEESSGRVATLRGQPVSPGLARGPARIATSPGQFDRILPGDILVTRGADPGWTPIFGRIAGLVMEVGGQLSHGAVVAREYGLPAVAGVARALDRLQDGQEIVVDGLSGIVTLETERE
jgi:pyruvate,water dikinase